MNGIYLRRLVFLDETSTPTTLTRRRARVLPAAQRTTIPAASHGMQVQNPAAYNAASFPS
jgi:pimeloyl-ACP methyl ester carboxylesterase